VAGLADNNGKSIKSQITKNKKMLNLEFGAWVLEIIYVPIGIAGALAPELPSSGKMKIRELNFITA
jgi:hypothetical protein